MWFFRQVKTPVNFIAVVRIPDTPQARPDGNYTSTNYFIKRG